MYNQLYILKLILLINFKLFFFNFKLKKNLTLILYNNNKIINNYIFKIQIFSNNTYNYNTYNI